MANGNLKSSAVFKMYLKNSQIRFELKNKSGMFLMLKELNSSVNEDVNYTTSSPVNITATISQEYAMVVYNPSESHLHVTMWENKRIICGALVMEVDEGTNCFIAFVFHYINISSCLRDASHQPPQEKNGSNQSFDFIKDFECFVKSLCD